MNFELIIRYFPSLTPVQVSQFKLIGDLYPEWNAKINVISRKDIANLYERHILYSLGIAKAVNFRPGTKVLDAGTGGGFPGVPLAVLFPQVNFHLVDSTAKKLTVVQNIAAAAGLNNITAEHARMEDHQGKYDFIVSRAVTSLPEFLRLVSKFVSDKNKNDIPNGILYLKGGEVATEVKSLHRDYQIIDLSQFFREEFFLTKKVIHIW